MNYGIHPDLDKILSKLSKKDKIQFEAILRKIDEIKDVENIDHYKNLKSSLEEYLLFPSSRRSAPIKIYLFKLFLKPDW